LTTLIWRPEGPETQDIGAAPTIILLQLASRLFRSPLRGLFDLGTNPFAELALSNQQIVPRLEIQPKLRAIPKKTPQPERCLRRYAPLPIQNGGNPSRRDAQSQRQLVGGQSSHAQLTS
jgi:hypothetical protein